MHISERKTSTVRFRERGSDVHLTVQDGKKPEINGTVGTGKINAHVNREELGQFIEVLKAAHEWLLPTNEDEVNK